MKALTVSLFLLARVHSTYSANLTSLVNLFIGTASGANGGSGGNAFPGSAIPHAMAKVGIDVSTSPRQAGYVHDNSTITGVSTLHDEGFESISRFIQSLLLIDFVIPRYWRKYRWWIWQLSPVPLHWDVYKFFGRK